MRKPSSVTEYLSWLSDEQRAALDALRAAIASAAPGSAEGISYSMPSFRHEGRGLVCYAAFTEHYSLFPMSTRVMTDLAELIGERATGKGTIRFAYGERLPVGLVRRVVKTRLAELDAKAGR